MATETRSSTPTDSGDGPTPMRVGEKHVEGSTEVVSEESDSSSTPPSEPAPWQWKFLAVVLISCISFGSSWSSGITGAIKTTMKKQLKITNTQFSLLESSEDFMVMVLILFTGALTDRLGGAGAILYGNIIYSIGSILVAAAAQVRSFRFMIAGRVISAIGDIATQVAQYKVFSSWFPPNHGFASTLAFELAVKKIGGFVGKASANPIAVNTGNFAWVFWIAVFMNIFTNVMTVAFYYFNVVAFKRFGSVSDPSTGEKLSEKNSKFDLKKFLELPWVFWCIIAFTMFETSTALVFTQNATELAEQRFGTDSITAGWYASVLQYAGFFVVPFLGLFVDLFGNRISLLAFCGCGVFLAMALVNWASTTTGTAAAFGIYAFAYTFGPTTIIDSIRTSMWDQSCFGSAYAVKIVVNNSMNIMVNIGTGVIQDLDGGKYTRVTIVYVALAGASVVVSLLLVLLARRSVDLGNLQWTRKQRLARGQLWNERRELFQQENGPRNRRISKVCFVLMICLMLGGWSAYIWGAVTGRQF